MPAGEVPSLLRTCAWCGADIGHLRPHAITCSRRCRQARNRHPSARASKRRASPGEEASRASSTSAVASPCSSTPSVAEVLAANRRPDLAALPSQDAGPVYQNRRPDLAALPSPVAALFVDQSGPYPRLVGPRLCWDAERDARGYAGPWPVVAHPPCKPWSVARGLARPAPGLRELAPWAVGAVRRWGGVLEHPAHSHLWGVRSLGLPRPGDPPDRWGGWTLAVCQGRWGHPARKPTWLYFVGCGPGAVPAGDDGAGAVMDLGAVARRRTPPGFAAWLVASVAASFRRPELRTEASPSTSPATVAGP